MNDPGGLFPPLLLFLGGKALALGIAAAGAYGSAWMVDRIKSLCAGKKSDDAVEAMNKLAPGVAAASSVSALPGVAAMGPGAVTAAGQRVGAALQASKYGRRIIQAGQFAEGFLNPNPAAASSIPGGMGTIVAQVIDKLERNRAEKK